MYFDHFNFNVANLDTSIAFYQSTLGLSVIKRKTAPDGSFEIAFLGEDTTGFKLELTCLNDHPQKYDLGECEFHLALRTSDYEAVHQKHKDMGVICFENPQMGIYFIEDPDGYWVEIVPEKK